MTGAGLGVGIPVSGTVESVAAARGIEPRDCRHCPRFEAQGDGLGYGWCRAHRQFVKLPQMAGAFWSQCQFKALTVEREQPVG